MAKITHRYDLPDYAAFMNMGFDLKLADDVLKSVSELADLVGAPTYVKTPVFPVRSELGSSAGTGTGDVGAAAGAGATTGYHIAGSSANTFQSRIGSNGDTFITRQSSSSSSSSSAHGGNGTTITRQRNASQQIPNSEWETILAFQKTEIQKKEGIELSIDNIRSYLNKLTDKTYTAMLSNILKEIAALFTASTDDKSEEHNTVAVMNRIASSIFTTASSNSFYSEIYARLFRDLMAEYAVFREVFEKNLASFMSLFETIEYCDPKKNYDKFCDINKANEKRKAMSLFIVNLMKNGIVEKTHVLAIMCQIQELMYTNMRQEGKTNEVDELAENLYIMVKHSHSVLKTAASSAAAGTEVVELFAERLEQIVEISKLKIKSKPSITNKTIFKHLDMLDEISGKSKK
jgi:chorismate mutase